MAVTTRSQEKVAGGSSVGARAGAGGVGWSWAQRIASERRLDVEVVQAILIRAAALAVAEGIAVGAPLAARLIGLPDDEPVVSVEGAVALAGGSVVEAHAALLSELEARSVRLRLDSAVRAVVKREVAELGVARRDRLRAEGLLYRLAALMPGEDVAPELERVLKDTDPVVRMPLREMIRETGWRSLERWLDEVTFWWVA